MLCILLSQLLLIVLYKWVNPPITITQLVNWVEGYGLKRDYVSWEEISPNMKLAVIASEDQTFVEHNGLDWESIKEARKHNEKHPNRIWGASTISQQTAKNVFLWQHGGYFRKGLEAGYTYVIDFFWGKQRILEAYLNVIEMGPGIFGVQAAAKTYFNKNASQLTEREAAMIAACLPNPKRYTVKPLSRYVARRTESILRQMHNISDVEEIMKLVR